MRFALLLPAWILSWLLPAPAAATAPAAVSSRPPLPAAEEPIVAHLQRFFATSDAAERRALVGRIEADPAYDRRRVGEWLHRLDLHPPRKPGRMEETVAVGFGHRRTLTLRIPRGYDPARPWPLIFLFHPSGGNGPAFLRQAEGILGKRADDFILAAPTHYRQTVFDAPPPFTPEHPVMLRWLRQLVHVDSDRVYVLGYSLGGYTAWTLAGYHADLYAGAVAMASTYSAPVDVAGMWEAFLPNSSNLPILHVWGERDGLGVPGFDGRLHSGTMSELNRRLSRLLVEKGHGNVIDRPIPGAGHGGARPPQEDLDRVLAVRRVRTPRRVEHRFRHLHQGRAYWLEAESWVGEHWGLAQVPDQPEAGESRAEALGRRVLPLLGELIGEIDGQQLSVRTRHVGQLDVWLGDGMIDWERPITLERDGEMVFAGKLTPDLGLCLAQAARTFDFDRLRWAGLRVEEEGPARPITAESAFPPLIHQP